MADDAGLGNVGAALVRNHHGVNALAPSVRRERRSPRAVFVNDGPLGEERRPAGSAEFVAVHGAVVSSVLSTMACGIVGTTVASVTCSVSIALIT
ncbi:MAG: hypothetical protein OXJ56_20265 [Rhodospirillaceae bacterium]|nr:hypothetical protein [Rhodospirillaceae bacterium]